MSAAVFVATGCGFSSLYRYDRMGPDLPERKLDRLVATARDIRG
jgi:hypothetical protein